MDDDDDDISDNDNDNGNIVISNLEILHDKMSCFESSFFETIKHPSNPDNKGLLLLDIQHPVADDNSFSNNNENNPLTDDNNPDPFDDILHDQFCPSVVIDNSHGTLAIEEDFDDDIFYEQRSRSF